jgi:hypothetical protein
MKPSLLEKYIMAAFLFNAAVMVYVLSLVMDLFQAVFLTIIVAGGVIATAFICSGGKK